MPRRALIDRRPYLLLSLIFAITYFFVMDGKVGGSWLALWKGAGIGLLAMYALHRGFGRDGAMIAIVMAVCALADVALEFSYLVGGVLFSLAHLVAINLFITNRRRRLSGSQTTLAVILALAPGMIAALLSWPQQNWWLATLYAALVGCLAATAWTSRFPRYRVGIGAILHMASVLVIIGREAADLTPDLAEWVIWPLYYTGQFLIALGVVQTLRKNAERHA